MKLSRDQAWSFARDWVSAWNAHDLERILEHYTEEVVLVSPVAAERFGEPSGTVRGKAALGNYFRTGLEKNPTLRFELEDVMWGIGSVVLYYKNQRGTKTGEVMELDENGKVTRVLANYNG